MEANISSKEGLNESLSKKEVTFCHKSSVLYYSVEGTVDSLNDSLTQTMYNSDIPLPSEMLSRFKKSDNIADSYSKCISEQCLSNLPEAKVILEKLPEALLLNHFYSNNVTQNIDKNCLSDSNTSYLKEITEPVMNQTILKAPNLSNKFKETSKNCVNEKIISEINDAYSKNFSYKVSRLNKDINNVIQKSSKSSKELEFNKEHSVLMQPNSDSIQQSALENSLQKSPSTTEMQTPECVNKNNNKNIKIIKCVESNASAHISSHVNSIEVRSTNKFLCVHVEKLNLEGISSSSDGLQNKKDMVMDLTPEIGNYRSIAGLPVSKKIVPLNEETSSKNLNLSSSVTDITIDDSSDVILSDKTYPKKSILKNLTTNSLKTSQDNNSISFHNKDSSKDTSLLQNENIVKVTNCDLYNPYENVQKKYPFVLLERLNLSSVNIDKNYNECGLEHMYTDSVQTVTNVPDLPIQIKNLCSVSKESFNKVQKHAKKSSNKSIISQFKRSGISSTLKPKSNQASLFKITCDTSTSSFSSGDSLSESMSLSHQKLIDAHSFLCSDDSSDDDIPLACLAETNTNVTVGNQAKGSYVKSYNHKKNSMQSKTSAFSLTETNSYPTVSTKATTSHVKSHKPKKKNAKHGNSKLSSLNPNSHRVLKKKNKKSLKRKQRKVYKMIMKYLKMEIELKKHKKKSKKRKNIQGNLKNSKSEMAEFSNNKDGLESDDSVAVIYESEGHQGNSSQNENSCKEKDKSSALCMTLCHNASSSTSEKSSKTKKKDKSVDKYRLGFLSNKSPLRFYNKFLASERLLLSSGNLKKNKKRKLKRLFNKLKAVGLISL